MIKLMCGLLAGLTLSLTVSLSYFLFCPHAGRNHRVTEIHMHVIPMGPPSIHQRPNGVLPDSEKFEVPDEILEKLDSQPTP